MTVDIHPDTVEEARDRGGDADADRPEAISEALEGAELGYGVGEPLVGDAYADYPSREQLSNPDRGEFLRDLLAHPQVDGLDSAVEELTGANDTATLGDWLGTLEAAADAHGLDVDTLTAKGEDEREQGGGDRLTSLLGYRPPEDMVRPDNPVLVAELYLLGLSVEEVADTLTKEVEGDVRPAHVRDTLKTVGLLEGRTREEQQEAFAEKDGRIGGTTFDRSEGSDSDGLTVNAEDFA
ncbi:hypothetical protein [Halobacterium salinarum]|uniref:Uncharacterized protein n=1 Tax=Halobacterium salinarum (strain ATCC 33171 / DSM 3754 / JCM 8978 / NBRC 102687 / NCIMB 764 / 91-R6) TaxID=2597657 RepID=A0A4D6GXT5_HALS9|nr:hypothetical protein [Halobacterium salinarum]QCC45528.1 uncharacterized protein HBSAL_09415 [Halobacterium salinarum]TYO81793.1 hypothetical protein APQ99_00303 [Halobacterium salinarum DSM 3754]